MTLLPDSLKEDPGRQKGCFNRVILVNFAYYLQRTSPLINSIEVADV